jgi:hypothetical protein
MRKRRRRRGRRRGRLLGLASHVRVGANLRRIKSHRLVS